ncbi:TetR/AcrR family transcriptional regulator [Hyphomicrobium sp. 99]|uniref:TetR/AcrR family transcriptional regulator n=1 Tax=Hyphomicrobium sp. 99 TaxID=1163419 RepID=UPI0005F8758B|nr:TetR/AcrR family transcriptional regulator [Hyphomicrobium sp. 99]
MTVTARARRKAERPGEILDAAFEEFVQRGYAATRLEDIAARAGVTKGTIYVYFESKERVFEALVHDLENSLREQVEPFFEDRGPPTAQSIRADLTMLYRVFANDRRGRELLRLLIAEAVRFPDLVDEHYRNLVGPMFEVLGQRLRQGVANGTFRPAPATNFPELLLGPALSLHIWKLLFSDRKPLDAELHFEAALDMILRGLLSPETEANRVSDQQ